MEANRQILIDKKLRSTLTESEVIEFNSLYTTDIEFKKHYNEELEITESIVYLSRKELYAELEHLENSSLKEPLQISWKKMLPIAASIIFILGFIWFLDSSEPKSNSSLVRTEKDSLKNTSKVVNVPKEIPETVTREVTTESINEDKKVTSRGESKNESSENSNPNPIERQLIVIVSKENEGFGYKSNEEKMRQITIELNESPLKYKFHNIKLALKGKVDTTAQFRLEIIKSLEGNSYRLFINENSFPLNESDIYMPLN